MFSVAPLILLVSTLAFAANDRPASLCAAKLGAISIKVTNDLDRVQAELKPFLDKLRLLPVSYRDTEIIKKRLAIMVEIDQGARQKLTLPEESGYSEEDAKAYREVFWEWIKEHDQKHIKELKKILKKHSWLKISKFGPEADAQAWLLVQHAAWDLPFQKRVLAKLKLLYPEGETKPSNYAYLYDRVAELEGRVQRYGTQGHCLGKGQWDIGKVENPSKLNEWRAQVGLSSIEDYIKLAAERLCK